jgi:hypothetical protein
MRLKRLVIVTFPKRSDFETEGVGTSLYHSLTLERMNAKRKAVNRPAPQENTLVLGQIQTRTGISLRASGVLLGEVWKAPKYYK